MKSWWIKQRCNPQTGIYYVPMGQMSKTAAKRSESSLYGYNTMHEYKTESEYEAEIERLVKAGEKVH